MVSVPGIFASLVHVKDITFAHADKFLTLAAVTAGTIFL
jgi:hypothetical protein